MQQHGIQPLQRQEADAPGKRALESTLDTEKGSVGLLHSDLVCVPHSLFTGSSLLTFPEFHQTGPNSC